jgi:hypothetical protein
MPRDSTAGHRPRRAWSHIGHKEQRQADLRKGEEGKVGNVDLSGERETPRGGGDQVRGRQKERVRVRVRAPFYTIVMQS